MFQISPRETRTMKNRHAKANQKKAALRQKAAQPLAQLKDLLHTRRIQDRQDAFFNELGLTRRSRPEVTLALPVIASTFLSAAAGAGIAVALLLHHAPLSAVVGASVGAATLILFVGLCAFRPLVDGVLRRLQAREQLQAEARYLAKHFAPAPF